MFRGRWVLVMISLLVSAGCGGEGPAPGLVFPDAAEPGGDSVQAADGVADLEPSDVHRPKDTADDDAPDGGGLDVVEDTGPAPDCETDADCAHLSDDPCTFWFCHPTQQTCKPATFADDSALATTVTFAQSGRYLLGLVAHDGELLRMDQVFVDVEISGGRPTTVFQQGLGGYTGTVDTVLVEAAPGADRSAAPEIGVDADDPGGSDQATQVLLRFEDIVGEGPGQILPGTPIRSARLELTSTDAGSGAVLHRMRRPWSDGDSWSSFGGDGIQAGAETAADADGSADAGDGGLISIDVTASGRRAGLRWRGRCGYRGR